MLRIKPKMGAALGSWVTTQRKAYKKASYLRNESQDLKRCLDECGRLINKVVVGQLYTD